MAWLLMFGGAVLGYALGNSVMHFLLGAATGYITGLCFEFNEVKESNKQLEAEVTKLKEDLSHYQQYIDKRLDYLNQKTSIHTQPQPSSHSSIDTARDSISETPVQHAQDVLIPVNMHVIDSARHEKKSAPDNQTINMGTPQAVRQSYSEQIQHTESHDDAQYVLMEDIGLKSVQEDEQKWMVNAIGDDVLAEIHGVLQQNTQELVSTDSPTLINETVESVIADLHPANADLADFVSQNESATTEKIVGVVPRALNPDIRLRSDTQDKLSQQTRHRPQNDEEEDGLSRGLQAVYQWFFGGNAILKVGVVILFLGLAFLLRYATEGMIVPIEMRYLGVVLASAGLVFVGWRLRERENHYGLILQGTGVGVLYLSCYAAMSMHALLAPTTVFVLMIIVAAFAVTLAIWQDSLSLAVAASMGGFAAPILASTGAGNHIALFSYFMVLNLAILSIAWEKAWRLLNLVGFVGTFSIGFTWGIQSFSPDIYISTQLFLLAFFVLYFMVGIFFAKKKLEEAGRAPTNREELLKWSLHQADYIDTTIVFGVPIIGFGLQYAITSHMANAAAMSALFVGGFYAFVATWLFKQDDNRTTLLAEINMALAVLFTTLSIPLYFEAQWTSASWALEAAGLYWIGLKQQRKLARLLAICLQAFAILAWLFDVSIGTENTLLQGSGFGAALIGISLLFTAWHITHNEDVALEKEQYWSIFCQWVGLSLLYIVPCFYGMHEQTALVWAVLSVLALAAAKVYGQPITLYHGLIMQFLATALYTQSLPFMGIGSGVVDWTTFNMLMTFGILFLFSTALFKDELQASWQDNPIYCNVLLALALISLAPLFILHITWGILIWVFMGLVMLRLAVKWQVPIVYGFALVLEAVAAICFIKLYSGHGLDALTWSANLYLPLALASVGFVNAWCMHHNTIADGVTEEKSFESRIKLLPNVFLIWGSVFWCVFVYEVVALLQPDNHHAYYLYAIAVSLLICAGIAKISRWPALAYLAAAVAPAASVVFVISQFDVHGVLMCLAWFIIAISHCIALNLVDRILPKSRLASYHFFGVLFLVLVASTGLFEAVQKWDGNNQTWLWLTWMVIPNLYLALMNTDWDWPWPVNRFATVYRQWAVLPLAAVLLCWYWLANALVDGQNGLLAYVPIVNPLELGLLLTLGNIMYFGYHQLPVNSDTHSHAHILLGASLFAFGTAVVFRASHQFANVPFEVVAQMQSMVVQASLSILWTIIAIGLMITGHRQMWRSLWLVGAVLIGVVVIKLFFVELGNSGSIERIASFIVVGLLLLVVGYFAPLPPRENADDRRG